MNKLLVVALSLGLLSAHGGMASNDKVDPRDLDLGFSSREQRPVIVEPPVQAAAAEYVYDFHPFSEQIPQSTIDTFWKLISDYDTWNLMIRQGNKCPNAQRAQYANNLVHIIQNTPTTHRSQMAQVLIKYGQENISAEDMMTLAVLLQKYARGDIRVHEAAQFLMLRFQLKDKAIAARLQVECDARHTGRAVRFAKQAQQPAVADGALGIRFFELFPDLQRYIVNCMDQTSLKAFARASHRCNNMVSNRGIINIRSGSITPQEVVEILASKDPKTIWKVVTAMSEASTKACLATLLSDGCHNLRLLKIYIAVNQRRFGQVWVNWNYQNQAVDNFVTINIHAELLQLLPECKKLARLVIEGGDPQVQPHNMGLQAKLLNATLVQHGALEVLATHCPLLREFSVRDNNQMSATYAGLGSQGLQYMTQRFGNLDNIDLSWNSAVTDAAFTAFLGQHRTLRSISVDRTMLTNASVDRIADLCPGLESLVACNYGAHHSVNGMDDATATHLVRTCLELRHLTLGNQVTDATLDMMWDPRTPHARKLRSLTLHGCPGVTLAPIVELVKKCQNLEVLDFTNSSVAFKNSTVLLALYAYRNLTIKGCTTYENLVLTRLPAGFLPARLLELNPGVAALITDPRIDPLKFAVYYYVVGNQAAHPQGAAPVLQYM
jgi:hypothetical protein